VITLLLACAPDYTVLTPKDSATEGPDETPDSSAPAEEDLTWEDASLVITSPESGQFLPLGEATTFSAVVYDKNGAATDFDEIQWSTNQDSAWSLLGRSIEDSSLDVGVHTLTAEVELPNGDRLVYAIGGVLVQSPYAGTYSGEVVMNAAYDTYAVGCSGSALLYIDTYGEAVTGEASCLISLMGYELDGTYNLDMQNAEGTVDGDLGLDLQWFELPIPATGNVSTDGAFAVSFETEFDIGTPVILDGTVEAIRISRDLPEN
jgi:hypothetical protein